MRDPSSLSAVRLARLAARLAVVAALLAGPLIAPQADAQYFGRNKVLWEDFEFQVLATEHFDIYYYPADHPAIDDLGRMAERWYQRLSTAFDHRLTERKPIIFYADQPDFRQTTVSFGLIGEGTGGFTEPLRNRVVLPLTGVYAETDHVLGHELVHAFQFDIASALAASRRNVALGQLPLWMIEGLAEYFSQGREDAQTAMWVRDGVVHDDLPDLGKLSRNYKYSPYQFGQAFWAYVGGRWDDRRASLLFGNALVLGPQRAIQETLGIDAETLFADWHEALQETYRPVLAGRQVASEAFRKVLSEETTRGRLNVAPAVSPDGGTVAFLSTRDLFSIDLYLADAETGRVRRKLLSAGADPHFDALRFLDSAGAWSPDGSRFAFVVFESGDHSIAMVDVRSGDVTRRYKPPVGAVSSPAFTPDGRSLVFSGAISGITDLWILDLESGASRRLTDDLYAALQPTVSPDGRTVAYVTDRGPGTDLGELAYRPLRIALYDLGSGEVRVLDVFEGAKHLDPQYSPDGRWLYFVADPDGVSDVFRIPTAAGTAAVAAVEGGAAERLTRVQTGVAGITELSPALSVAARSGRAMFSVREDFTYNVYALEPPADAPAVTRAEVEAAPEAGGIRLAALLPPAPVDAARPTSTVAAYLDRPQAGLLPPDPGFEVEPYDPRFGLTYLGPPVVGFGADRTGFGLGGSVSAFFSDILNRHLVGVTLQGGASSGAFGSTFGGQLNYLNQANRLNWGAEALHVPIQSVRTTLSREPVEIDGEIVVADVLRQIRQETTIDEVQALAQYPLSLTRRFEVAGGWTRYSFDAEVEEVFIVGNTVIADRISGLPTFEDLDLYSGSLAFVGDSSVFGFASPVRGARYRFEVETNGGDLDYQTGLADARRYVFARPVTFAARGLFFGRYGDDAEDPRLSDLYLGRETLVRGYSIGDIDVTECTRPEGSNVCPEFDRLIGSRIAVASLEVRVPLFGVEGYGLIELPFLPTELVGFVDAGAAWTEDETVDWRFDEDTVDRVPVVSAGVALRTVLGGYLPLHFYYAKPFQRPETDWQFGFIISPGW